MSTYIGLDAHSSTSTFVSLDEAGKIVDRCRVDTTEKHLLGFVRNQKGKTRLVVEESSITQWVYALLNQEVDELVVCHPGYLGKKQGPKNDLRDATHVANELRCGHVTPVFHEQSKMMDLRALVGAYTDVIREIVRAKNRYKAPIKKQTLNDTRIHSPKPRLLIMGFASNTLWLAGMVVEAPLQFASAIGLLHFHCCCRRSFKHS